MTKNNPTTAKNVTQYIASFPVSAQKQLRQVRALIRKFAPDAEETIKYQMATYVWNGNLVFFAGYKKHIGFFPGAYRFSYDKPIPVDLVERVVKMRVEQNKKNAKRRKK